MLNAIYEEDPADRIRSLAAKDRESRGLGKPETVDFLGFTHICSRSRRGAFQLKRQTRRDTGSALLAVICALKYSVRALAASNFLAYVSAKAQPYAQKRAFRLPN
jgi:hypothetical protein